MYRHINRFQRYSYNFCEFGSYSRYFYFTGTKRVIEVIIAR